MESQFDTDLGLQEVPAVVAEDLAMSLHSMQHTGTWRLVRVVEEFAQLLDRLTQLYAPTDP